jgi:hypothetical protein
MSVRLFPGHRADIKYKRDFDQEARTYKTTLETML